MFQLLSHPLFNLLSPLISPLPSWLLSHILFHLCSTSYLRININPIYLCSSSNYHLQQLLFLYLTTLSTPFSIFFTNLTPLLFFILLILLCYTPLIPFYTAPSSSSILLIPPFSINILSLTTLILLLNPRSIPLPLNPHHSPLTTHHPPLTTHPSLFSSSPSNFISLHLSHSSYSSFLSLIILILLITH
jgi:hypothetical protein